MAVGSLEANLSGSYGFVKCNVAGVMYPLEEVLLPVLLSMLAGAESFFVTERAGVIHAGSARTHRTVWIWRR
jgi:hypothetical protein